MKYDYKCEHCKEDGTVIWDAYATWDTKNQKHVLYSSYDHCECHDCGSTDIIEIHKMEDIVK